MKKITKSQLQSLAEQSSVSTTDVLRLLAAIMDMEYPRIAIERTFELKDGDLEKLKMLILRRRNNESIAKILQKTEFYGIDFITNANTLDPRPETELLVDLFRKYHNLRDKPMRLLDLGCGTGCIGLAILTLYPNVICDFIDVSADAIDIAKKNAKKLNLHERCEFIISNWFSNIRRKYDAIVSNPPYVAEDYELKGDVLSDPKIALFAGKDGMDSFRIIIDNSSNFMKTNAKLFLEIGYKQANAVISLTNKMYVVEVAKDLSGISRALVLTPK
jgi:release factor glutamine methyltransferase